MSSTPAFWLIGLVSAGISAVVSGFISGIFNIRTKRHEYINEYYKLVLNRRLAAYETLEKLILLIKTAVKAYSAASGEINIL